MKRLMGLAALLAGSGAFAQQGSTPDFEYHGYMRSGFGFSRGGTDQACFQAPSSTSKFRLGNECETYIEAQFVKYHLLGKSATEPHFKTNFRLAAVSGGERDWEPTDPEAQKDAKGKDTFGTDFTLSLREAYVEGVNVLGKTRPWVGKRFYRRQDIHILDFYLFNNSGPGAGVEGIETGPGLLHVAALRNIPNGAPEERDDGPAQTNVDLRYSDLKLGDAGTLETVVIHGSAGNRGHATGEDKWEKLSGTQLGLIHSLDVLGGFNRVTLQYGQGIFGGAGGGSTLGEYGAGGTQNVPKGADDALDARKKSTTLRLVEELVGNFGPSLATSFVLLYQDVDFGGEKDGAGGDLKNKNELTVGARPVYSFNDTASLALEVGSTSVKNIFDDATKEYTDATLTKVTIAPQLSAGNSFWARPQLRLFATYATWNDDAKGRTTGGSSVYAKDTTGFSTGAQLEAWW